MNSTPQPDISQGVVIHDQTNNTLRHPVVHYVFEGEDFPNVPKEQLILIDIDPATTTLNSIDSYSPHFQVTDCQLEQSIPKDTFEEAFSTISLTIEGVSAPRLEDAEPIRSLDHLKESLLEFKTRNELANLVFSPFISEQI
ncbi:hypothetical protein PHYBLDRAFT_138159 [Phycomyces blakesleeanus NRRL 1555(-)]|uniref:Uncharacterized protein n=1 Tax=Phycomyces blakesleeanus (strain ATCC 8743b / DSM 1359 / FGSC 10004 / NBRC 33097 / NRRL 1555) TaxID=763407 RepID=A0A162Q6T1_PHYB8|nr:hypothetical protein PHYBLDRAFT_138159 [Phycomyces blakesleeanus NRRL 1555(-)]OAD80606.1 hypothetical protein PHYBLDRAFT_138159 [Phycomyces blakesleeanus NRRL 1555(-)]|eukprot:XP_018298646.1 hypothetical protein PHYBLDRAFT_138159 [Phycomyces blakesleeanus NRRL 1555(-)]